MSWKGQVVSTERHGDRLDINIHYTDGGDNQHDQTISTTVSQDDNWLTDQITAKLSQLNILDDYEALVNQDSVLTSSVTLDETGVAVETPVDPVISPPIDITPLDTPPDI